MKHVLITGGAGFIGSHLCERFLKEGYAVTAMDNLVTGNASNIAGCEKEFSDRFQWINADVSESWDLKKFKLLEKHGLDLLLHFACPASPIDFEKIPVEILKVDSYGTFNAAEVAMKYKARMIIASTSEIYGDPLEHPQKETYWGNVNTLGPRACYDETKRFAEAVVSSYVRMGVLNGGMVRIFNTYGPRMRPDDGRVVPQLCMEALKGEQLSVHGDGMQTRSFCFVTDLVEGIYRYSRSNLSEPVNLGNPVERSIVDFAKVILEITGSKSTIKFNPGRPDDPKKRCPDISRAKKHLDWEPKVSLHEGLKETLAFFRTCLR